MKLHIPRRVFRAIPALASPRRAPSAPQAFPNPRPLFQQNSRFNEMLPQRGRALAHSVVRKMAENNRDAARRWGSTLGIGVDPADRTLAVPGQVRARGELTREAFYNDHTWKVGHKYEGLDMRAPESFPLRPAINFIEERNKRRLQAEASHSPTRRPCQDLVRQTEERLAERRREVRLVRSEAQKTKEFARTERKEMLNEVIQALRQDLDARKRLVKTEIRMLPIEDPISPPMVLLRPQLFDPHLITIVLHEEPAEGRLFGPEEGDTIQTLFLSPGDKSELTFAQVFRDGGMAQPAPPSETTAERFAGFSAASEAAGNSTSAGTVASQPFQRRPRREVVLVLPKAMGFGDQAPRDVKRSEYAENFCYYRIDPLSIVQYLQEHNISPNDPLPLEKLRQVLALIGLPMSSSEEVQCYASMLEKEQARRDRLDTARKAAENARREKYEELDLVRAQRMRQAAIGEQEKRKMVIEKERTDSGKLRGMSERKRREKLEKQEKQVAKRNGWRAKAVQDFAREIVLSTVENMLGKMKTALAPEDTLYVTTQTQTRKQQSRAAKTRPGATVVHYASKKVQTPAEWMLPDQLEVGVGFDSKEAAEPAPQRRNRMVVFEDLDEEDVDILSCRQSREVLLQPAPGRINVTLRRRVTARISPVRQSVAARNSSSSKRTIADVGTGRIQSNRPGRGPAHRATAGNADGRLIQSSRPGDDVSSGSEQDEDAGNTGGDSAGIRDSSEPPIKIKLSTFGTAATAGTQPDPTQSRKAVSSSKLAEASPKVDSMQSGESPQSQGLAPPAHHRSKWLSARMKIQVAAVLAETIGKSSGSTGPGEPNNGSESAPGAGIQSVIVPATTPAGRQKRTMKGTEEPPSGKPGEEMQFRFDYGDEENVDVSSINRGDRQRAEKSNLPPPPGERQEERTDFLKLSLDQLKQSLVKLQSVNQRLEQDKAAQAETERKMKEAEAKKQSASPSKPSSPKKNQRQTTAEEELIAQQFALLLKQREDAEDRQRQLVLAEAERNRVAALTPKSSIEDEAVLSPENNKREDLEQNAARFKRRLADPKRFTVIAQSIEKDEDLKNIVMQRSDRDLAAMKACDGLLTGFFENDEEMRRANLLLSKFTPAIDLTSRFDVKTDDSFSEEEQSASPRVLTRPDREKPAVGAAEGVIQAQNVKRIAGREKPDVLSAHADELFEDMLIDAGTSVSEHVEAKERFRMIAQKLAVIEKISYERQKFFENMHRMMEPRWNIGDCASEPQNCDPSARSGLEPPSVNSSRKQSGGEEPQKKYRVNLEMLHRRGQMTQLEILDRRSHYWSNKEGPCTERARTTSRQFFC